MFENHEPQPAVEEPAIQQPEGTPVEQEPQAAPAEPAGQQPEGTPAETEPPAEPAPQQPESAEPESPRMTPELVQQMQQRIQQNVFRQMVGDIPNPETGRPFQNPAEFAAWRQRAEMHQRAQQAGVDPAQYQRIVDEAAQLVKQSDPELLQMRAQLKEFHQRAQQETFARDLAAIKAAYPDEQAKSVTDLGNDFMAIMATGQLDAVRAYEAIRGKRNATRKQPPSMGPVAAGGSEPKTFYEKDEVARMSPAEIEKNLDAINNSMKHWK